MASARCPMSEKNLRVAVVEQTIKLSRREFGDESFQLLAEIEVLPSVVAAFAMDPGRGSRLLRARLGIDLLL